MYPGIQQIHALVRYWEINWWTWEPLSLTGTSGRTAISITQGRRITEEEGRLLWECREGGWTLPEEALREHLQERNLKLRCEEQLEVVHQLL